MDHHDPVLDRRPGVLSAISLIRCLFTVQRLDANGYSDGEIVDALLDAQPESEDRWLSRGHIASAFEHLTRHNVRAPEAQNEAGSGTQGSMR